MNGCPLVLRSASCIGPSVKLSENLFPSNISGSNILYHLFFLNLCTTEYKLWNCYESYATRTGIQIVVTRTAIEQTFERKRQKFLWNVFFFAYGITEISIINERLKITSSSCTDNPGRIFIPPVPYFSEVQVGPFVKQSENLFARNISGSNILYHLFFS